MLNLGDLQYRDNGLNETDVVDVPEVGRRTLAARLAEAQLEAGMPAVLSRVTGSRGRGRRMGLYSTFQFLGAFVGGVAGGWLLSRFGGSAALVCAGLVCLLWGLVLLRYSSSFFPTGKAA